MLYDTAVQAGLTATHTAALAVAFEITKGAVARPEEITANRTLMRDLLNSNVLGVHTTAIGECDRKCQQMVAQSQGAMTAYRNAVAHSQAELHPWPGDGHN